MLLVKWDLNDADYIYKIINLKTIEQEKELRTILQKFIVTKTYNDGGYRDEVANKRIYDFEDINIEGMQNLLTTDDLVDLYELLISETDTADLSDPDFYNNLVGEFLPKNTEDGRYAHHIKEVSLWLGME